MRSGRMAPAWPGRFKTKRSSPSEIGGARMKTLKVDNVAQAYLDLLEDRGVDFFLANAGTDFATLVDAFARREAEGKRAPRPMVVPHESVAVGMAHGAWPVSYTHLRAHETPEH